ncbi:MAG: hypothetical protein PHU81_01925 [Acidobacteriota bacterium]|nr:hypothetical protein [Acidobacteriota bacterium]
MRKKGNFFEGKARAALIIYLFFCLTSDLLASIEVEICQSDDLETALKIIDFLEEADRYRQEKGCYQNKTAEFSEEEVSSFFRYLFSEEAPAVKTIRLKLLLSNKIEGWILLNLKDQGLPSYFKDEINLYFAARLETDSRRIRLNVSKLYLETELIKPEVVNFLIDLIARGNGLEPQHLDDWYELPAGVFDLKTDRGKLLVYY